MSGSWSHRGWLAGCALLLAASIAQGKPVLELRPGTVKPGDSVLVSVEGSSPEPQGTLAGRPLHFYKFRRGFRALAALPVEAPVGPAEVNLSLAGTPLSGSVDVIAPDFPARELTVESKFLEPTEEVKERLRADQEAFDQAFSQPFEGPLWSQPFAWPIRSVVTAHFGDRRVFNGKQQSQHYGTDLEGRVGTPVSAANEGKVVMARDCFAAGKTIVLNHGAGVYTTYFHLSKMEVQPGAMVKSGQRLGRVGATGRVTGPHLHWGVKLDGLYVNAESLLALRFD